MRTEARLALALSVGLTVYLLMGSAAAQSVPDAQALVVTGQPAAQGDFTAEGSDVTWPTAAAITAWRLLSVLERLADRVMAFGDRWLDRTQGKIKLDIKKTVIGPQNYGPANEMDTGPIVMNRRRGDPDRNDSSEDEPQ